MANLSSGPGVEIDGPICDPSPYGIFSVATIEDLPEGHWMDGTFHEQESCDDLLVVSQFCEPHTKTDSAAGPAFPESDTFVVVAGYECATAGDTLAVAHDRAEERLAQGEERSVERTFWTGKDGTPAANTVRTNLNQNPDAVDLTPGGVATSITNGLALLESWAGENMACRPVLHVNRGVAVYLDKHDHIRPDGDVMFVRSTGSRVVVGGGYLVTGPNGVAAPAGEGWLYITGAVKILRSPVFFTPPRDDQAAAVDLQINDVAVFAERFYSVSLGCGLAAVRVTLTDCC